MTRKLRPCAYCGSVTQRWTRDHIVPRAMWCGARLPKQMVIVAACRACQVRWDAQVSYFRDVLLATIPAASRSSLGKRAGETEMPPAKRRRHRLQSLIMKVEFITRSSASESAEEAGVSIELDLSRFNLTLEKIVRGFAFHQTQKPLPKDYQVRIYPGNPFQRSSAFDELRRGFSPPVDLGDDVFRVRWQRDASDPHLTLWLLEFYGVAPFIAWSEPRGGRPPKTPVETKTEFDELLASLGSCAATYADSETSVV